MQMEIGNVHHRLLIAGPRAQNPCSWNFTNSPSGPQEEVLMRVQSHETPHLSTSSFFATTECLYDSYRSSVNLQDEKNDTENCRPVEFLMWNEVRGLQKTNSKGVVPWFLASLYDNLFLSVQWHIFRTHLTTQPCLRCASNEGFVQLIQLNV